MSDPVHAIIDGIRRQLDDLRAAYDKTVAPPPPPPIDPAVIRVRRGENLPSILERAPANAHVLLDVDVVHDGPLTIATPVTLSWALVTLSWALPESAPVRMDTTTPLPQILGGVRVRAPHVTLRGLEMRHTDRHRVILELAGNHVTVDRCRVLGDPLRGARRGISGNAADVTVVGTYVDHCWHTEDAQAFVAWDSPGPFLLDNCHFSASGESVMFGGADPSSEAHIPADIVMTHCLLTKRLEWRTQAGATVKNTLELKNAKRVRIEGNVIEHSWKGGQSGYLLVLTPRNQDGRAPWSTVEDVLIRENLFRAGAAAMNILGRDDHSLASTLKRVTIQNNRFDDLDPVVWGGGSPRMIQIGDGPSDLTIATNTFTGKNLTSAVYLFGPSDNPCRNLVIEDNVWPATKYGIKSDGTVSLTQRMTGASRIVRNVSR